MSLPVSLRRLGILPRCAFKTIQRTLTAFLGQDDARPGMVAAVVAALVAVLASLRPRPSVRTPGSAGHGQRQILEAREAGRIDLAEAIRALR